MNKYIDIHDEAIRIISKHTAGVMSCADYKPENNDELMEFMIDECAYILTKDFLDGKYTPMQYNDIRNEISKTLWKLFAEQK
jgi:hypothetical protein